MTGSSAGAYGAFFNAPLHHDVWPDSQFSVLGDAGNGIITPDFLHATTLPELELRGPPADQHPGRRSRRSQDGTGIPAYTEAVADYFPNTAWGHYTSSYDGGTGGQTGFFNVMQNPSNVLQLGRTGGTPAASGTHDDGASRRIATAAAVPSNYRYYIGTGSRHTMYGSNKVYTDTTGGVPTIVDWVNVDARPRRRLDQRRVRQPDVLRHAAAGRSAARSAAEPPFSQVGTGRRHHLSVTRDAVADATAPS